MNELVSIAKALGDDTRLRALASCSEHELCVCQVTELLQLAPSTVSKHMSILKQAGLVEGRKEGRWMYYRWAGKQAPPSVRQALKWVRSSIAEDRVLQDDAIMLEKILQIDPELLCRRQSGRCGK